MAGDGRLLSWARTLPARRLATFIEDLWGAASGDNSLATLDAIETVIARYQPGTDRPGTPSPLTSRETQILSLLSSGMTIPQAGHELGISEGTARSLSQSAYKRIRARNATEAVAIAIRGGWLPEQAPPEIPPPPPRRSPQAWNALVEQCVAQARQQPGQPVDLGPYTSRTGAQKSAWRIRRGIVTGTRPAGSFEAPLVLTDEGHWNLRVRSLDTSTAPTTSTISTEGAAS